MQNSAFLNTKQVLGRCFLLSSVILAASTAPAYGIQLDFSTVEGDLTDGDANGVGATMTFEDVATDSRTNTILDLVVTTVSNYTTPKPGNNGLVNANTGDSNADADGRINITSNTSTTFQFSFVEANTTNSYTVDTVEFGLFDIDGSLADKQEKVILYTSGDYVVTAPPNETDLIISTFSDRVEFLSPPTPTTNPTDTRNLTLEQEQHAVNFVFENVADFQLGFESINGNQSRNFFFAGDVVFDSNTATTDFAAAVPFEFSPGLGLLLSGGGLLGIRRLKRRKLQKSI